MLNVTALSLLLVLAGCASAAGLQMVGRDGTIGVSGVSVVPPKDPGWRSLMNTTFQLSIGKEGRNYSTYVANAQIYKLSGFTSEEEFLKIISEGRRAEPETGRFALVKNDEVLTRHEGALCVKYHTVTEDRAARTPDGPKTMLRNEYGYHCQHPNKKNIGVWLSYSLRHNAQDADPDLERKAGEFFQGIRFGPF
jgi:hypothetical protein